MDIEPLDRLHPPPATAPSTSVSIPRAILPTEFVIFAVAAVFVAVSDQSLRSHIFDNFKALTSLLASVGMLFGLRMTLAQGRESARAWRYFGIAWCFWLSADLAHIVHTQALHLNSFPNWTDLLRLSAYPLFITGILALPRSPMTLAERVQVYLDTAIALIAALLVAANYLFIPLMERSITATGWQTAAVLTYAFLDLAILWAVLELLLRRFPPGWAAQLGLLAASVTLLGLGDFGFTVLVVRNQAVHSGLAAAAGIFSGIFGWLSGIVQSQSASPPRPYSSESDRPSRIVSWPALLPYFWVAVVFALFARSRVSPMPLGQDVLAASAVLLVALVLIRQALVLRDNRRLVLLLREAHAELDKRVQLRTTELEIANRNLKEQIKERQRAEDERRVLERQVLQTQKLESLGILAGGLAHDFNNLLVGILGNADLALTEPPGSEAIRTHIEDVRRAALRAADLTNQMLAYSGRGRFVITTLNLNEVVDEMVLLLKASLSKKITFDLRFDAQLPRVDADPNQFRQVILNLITNAAEAIEDRAGEINVTTGTLDAGPGFFEDSVTREDMPAGAYVFLTVSDTGHGMDRNTLVRIFDPFFSTKFAGRGLGLSAVLGIVRGHKGAIKVDSELGRGSKFTLYFPVSRKSPPASAPDPAASGKPWRGEGLLLLVDDEESVRTVCRRMLERMGFSVVTAADGMQGLQTFREKPGDFRAVMLDVTMPVMNGDEACREMKKLRPDIPVILASGYTEQDAIRRFTQTHVSAFIQKPFDGKTLELKIRAALGGGSQPHS